MMSDAVSYFCTYCDDEIDVAIKCQDCSEFYLCHECYGSNAEIGPHKKTHTCTFVVGNPKVRPLFPGRKDWLVEEVDNVLTMVLRVGLSSWEEIAAAIKTKTPAEIEEHFWNMHINGNIGKVVFSSIPSIDVKDHTLFYSPPIPGATTIVDEHIEEKEIHETITYMPFSDDYFYEFDNSAERDFLLVASNTEYSEDKELELLLQNTQIEILQSRIRRRHKRHRVVNEYGLIKEFELAENPKSSKNPTSRGIPDGERLLRENLKIFSRLMSAYKMESLIQDLKKEKVMKAKLKKLKSKLSKFKVKARKAIKQRNKDSYKLLTREEKKFCFENRLKPNYFIAVKFAILTKERGDALIPQVNQDLCVYPRYLDQLDE